MNFTYFYPFVIIFLMTNTLIQANNSQLVDIKSIIPDIVLDIRYATTNNFTKQKVYSRPCCYLQKTTAEKLCKVHKELAELGFGLKIFDGYRPLSVQKIFWDVVPDSRYVMPPHKGSKHNRGSAVDLTLVTKDGKEVPMPTEFDDFSTKAHRDYKDLPAHIIANRNLLERVMHKHGFKGLRTEWWHFDDVDWQKYPLLDISFEKLT